MVFLFSRMDIWPWDGVSQIDKKEEKKTPSSDLVIGTPPYSGITFIMFFIFLLEI